LVSDERRRARAKLVSVVIAMAPMPTSATVVVRPDWTGRWRTDEPAADDGGAAGPLLTFIGVPLSSATEGKIRREVISSSVSTKQGALDISIICSG
jgi:hypothetical protein